MSNNDSLALKDPGLKRRLGVPSIVFAVVAWAAPLLVVQGLMPSMVVYSRNSLLLAFAILTIILIFFGVGYTNITKHVQNPGAYYAYITAGLGKSAGLGGAFVAVFGYGLLLLSTWIAFGTFFRILVMEYGGPEVPWFVWAFIGAIASGIIAYVRVDLSTKVMMVLLICEALIIIIFTVAVFVKGGPDGVATVPLTPKGWGQGSIALGMLYATLCFIGFESSTIYREEAKDPIKTITTATYIAIIGIGVFYLFSAWAMLTALGEEGVMNLGFDKASTLFNELCVTYVSAVMPKVTNIMICTSTFASLLAQHNSISRYLYSLGKDGIIPAKFGMAHPKHRSPSFAVIVTTIAEFAVILLVMICTKFETAGDVAYMIYVRVNGLGTMTVIVLMVLVSIAILVFFAQKRRKKDGETPEVSEGGLFKTIIAPIIALAGLFVLFVMVVVNVNELIGAGPVASILMTIIILPVVFFVGFGLATRLKKTNPDIYNKIGRN